VRDDKPLPQELERRQQRINCWYTELAIQKDERTALLQTVVVVDWHVLVAAIIRVLHKEFRHPLLDYELSCSEVPVSRV
jgi:hypothetical protein